MADGLNKLRSRAVLNCCDSSVSNVAVFLCRAEEKLLFLSEAQSQYLRPLPKKANPFTLQKSFSVRNTQMQRKLHKNAQAVCLSQSERQANTHTHSLTHSLVIILSRRDQVNEGSGGDHKKQRLGFLWLSLIALTGADL